MAYHIDQETQKSNSDYIRHTMAAPILDKGHEQDLARAWRDHKDEKALHELIESYTRLVVAMAHKFKHYGLPLSDLIQEGNIGLLYAANRFEADRDIRFSTYASWWIRSSMQDYILRNWSIVRTGSTSAQKSLFFNLRRLRARIEGAAGEFGLTNHGRTEISKALGVSIKDVESMEGRLGGDQSLNIKIANDSDDEYGEFLADDRPTPEDIVIGMKDAESRSKWLASALNQLSSREQKIIRDRHLKYETVTLEDLGKELGISKERVRQLEFRAMEKLKDSLVAGGQFKPDQFSLVA
jgi:RNA polymerase sigma-32 factor